MEARLQYEMAALEPHRLPDTPIGEMDGLEWGVCWGSELMEDIWMLSKASCSTRTDNKVRELHPLPCQRARGVPIASIGICSDGKRCL